MGSFLQPAIHAYRRLEPHHRQGTSMVDRRMRPAAKVVTGHAASTMPNRATGAHRKRRRQRPRGMHGTGGAYRGRRVRLSCAARSSPADQIAPCRRRLRPSAGGAWWHSGWCYRGTCGGNSPPFYPLRQEVDMGVEQMRAVQGGSLSQRLAAPRQRMPASRAHLALCRGTLTDSDGSTRRSAIASSSIL